MLKFPKQQGRVQEYESSVIALSNGNIVDLGETFSPEDIELEKRLANSGDYHMSFFRKVSAAD